MKTTEMTINYNEQMLNYYPEVIKAVREFQVLIESQSLEVEEMHQKLTQMLLDAYITTASEKQLTKWEQFLNLTPLPQNEDSLETWLSDRRESILARLYQTSKLNTNAIGDIVRIFTGGMCESYFKDGVIYILVNLPKNNKHYKFENLVNALKDKLPAHLMCRIERNYFTWEEAKDTYGLWNNVLNSNLLWEGILYTTLDNAKK